MKFISRFMSKLNNQLFITYLVVIVGVIIAFGVILPISSQYIMDHRIYDLILDEQEKFLSKGESIENGLEYEVGVYHVVCYQEGGGYEFKDISQDVIHHLLMYESFFRVLDSQIVKQQASIDAYKFTVGKDSIYYIINRNTPGRIIVSYKIDNTSSTLAHQLFMNGLVVIAITFLSVLIVFIKWNKRLVDNLKDIQLVLDRIDGQSLQTVISTQNYTREFQKVMISLERMRQRLFEEERIKQDMMHNMSHDLKTPLSVIKNYAEGLIDGVYPYGTVEETANVIYNQADRLQNKVQGLLYLNRLDYIKSKKEVYKAFPIKKIVSEVVGYMQDLDTDIKISLDVDESTFLGEEERWQIVIENLLDNAKRYAQSTVKVVVKDHTLSIYNDGPHIEVIQGEMLFKPFEAGNNGVTGLGLAIVKKTVELYGYQIEFKNMPRGGVSFIIQ